MMMVLIMMIVSMMMQIIIMPMMLFVIAIFSLYLIVFVVHYISSFPVAELLVIKIGIGVILLRIRHYEPNLQPYQQTYFSQHYRSKVYKCKELIVTINRSSTSLSSTLSYSRESSSTSSPETPPSSSSLSSTSSSSSLPLIPYDTQ